MQQHLQPADHPPARRSDRGGQRCGPRIVDGVQQHRDRGQGAGIPAATSAGMVLTSTSAAATASANPPLSNAQNRVATPTRVPRSTSRAALSELRATTVMSVTPSSASPTTAAGAVPRTPAPARVQQPPPTPRPPRRCRCCRPASHAASEPGCWPNRQGPRVRCARRRTAGRRTCPAWSPKHRPTPVRNHRPRRATRPHRIRCAHRSSRAAPTPGRRPGAAAGSGNARSANQARRLFGTFAHRALSRTPLCLASSMFARCC